MAVDLDSVVTDLRDETGDLDALLRSFDAEVLNRPTPAAGWTVGDTVGHLWFFDREAIRALTDPEGFAARLAELLRDPDGFLAGHLAAAAELGDVLAEWRTAREDLVVAIRAADPDVRVPWYGPAMSVPSFTTARLMETWAHGQDIADALGIRRTPTDRIRHICHLGVRTRRFSYAVRGRTPPEAPVVVTLTAPSGEIWSWGPPDAADSVSGPAEDFCLLVTQRRHLDDLTLTVTGSAADEWIQIAQAFAGAPTTTDPARRRTGRAP